MSVTLDLETYSDIDLTKAGLYKYAQSPAFQILLCSYKWNDGPVITLDCTTDKGRRELASIQGLFFDASELKHAYNAAFEWYCLSRHFGLTDEETVAWLPQWRDTQLHALYSGLPTSLAAVGEALELGEDKKKNAIGKALIRYFCVPCKPTKSNGGRTRNLPHHDPEKWELFKEYNAQDVVAETEIDRRLSRFPVPDEVQKQWETDLTINLRGVAVDLDLVDGAQAVDAEVREELVREAVELTGLDNPNSRDQLIGWLEEETGEAVTDLRKATVSDMLGGELPDGASRRVLEIRQELGKTSIRKYRAIETAVCDDGRVRGILQFYGANRTGRWAGRIVQPQNLPRTYIPGGMLPLARNLVKDRRTDALRLIYGSVSDTLSQLIRTALVAAPGKILVDADFSAIEARVLAWLAGEKWRLEVFRTHGKIYEASASQMFGVPMEKIVKGNPEYALRQRGKVAELALGYGGGVAAMRAMDTGKILIDTPDEEISDIVQQWRNKSPAIIQFWRELENAARYTINTGCVVDLRFGTIRVAREMDPVNDLDYLTVQLPSGRKLYYSKPFITTNRFGRPSVGYWGVSQDAKKTTKKWQALETYGGKLAENITQAVARDCLAEAVTRLHAAGYHVVFHVHDEVVIEAEPKDGILDDVVRIMSFVPEWAEGLPLGADGWTDEYYKKD